MSYLEENANTGRIIFPDLVRAFALFGIVVVNVAFFAFPGELTYHAGGLNSAWDERAYFLINALFLMKSYTLFSFMFGVGLAYQMMSAERRQRRFGAQYFRRLTGLIMLGVLHVSLAFVGDILIIYGVLGVVLYWFRNAVQKTLLRTGIALIVLQIVICGLFALAMLAFEVYDPANFEAMLQEVESEARTGFDVYANGGFSVIAERRWQEWFSYIVFILPMQAPGVVGFFLLGLAAVRAGALSDTGAPIWSTARHVYLPVGLIISVVGAYVFMVAESAMNAQATFGMMIMMIGAPFSSLGYMGLLAKWSDGPVSAVKQFFARAGSASLSTYLLQSLILSLVFCGYGLGLYGQLGAAKCILIAAVTGLVSIGLSSAWRARFQRGPMEALLRKWTYFE